MAWYSKQHSNNKVWHDITNSTAISKCTTNHGHHYVCRSPQHNDDNTLDILFSFIRWDDPKRPIRSQGFLCNFQCTEPSIVPGIFLGVRSANEGRPHNVMSSLISWAHTQNDPCGGIFLLNFLSPIGSNPPTLTIARLLICGNQAPDILFFM